MTTSYRARAPYRGGPASRRQADASRGGRPSYQGNRRSFNNAPRRSQGRPAQRIDASRFINKTIQTDEEMVYAHQHTFADFDIDPRIKHNITAKGYAVPTPIQDQAIKHILEGRDIVGIANTGTGKTGAFLIPLLQKIVKHREKRILVIVPTRELASQIDQEFKDFARGSGFLSVCAVGGANINPQIRGLRQDPCIVIGTPGRLKDLMERRVLNLAKFDTVVLDEADRMLDMGFIHDMKFILSHMPKVRHTIFFSATLSRDIEALIGSFLNDPVRISVKTGETAKNVDQDIVRTNGKHKLDVLHELLSQPAFSK